MSESHRCHTQKFRQDCFCRHITLPEQKNLSQAAYSSQVNWPSLSCLVFSGQSSFSVQYSIAYSEWELYVRGSARVSVHLLDFCGVLFRAQLSHPLIHTEVHPVKEKKTPHFKKALESVWHQLIATLLEQSSSSNKTSPALPFEGDISQLPLIWLPKISKTRAPCCHHLHTKPS